MRIDKYLWCVRFFKTRSLATKICKGGHVRVNGKKAKPAHDVFPTDEIDVRKNKRDYKIKVLDLPKSRQGAKWIKLFMLDITPTTARADQRKFSQGGREKGTGRPTKKERRELDAWLAEKTQDWADNDDLDNNHPEDER